LSKFTIATMVTMTILTVRMKLPTEIIDGNFTPVASFERLSYT
jgi:hypothetical protein